jgi:hypothetical protein
MSIIEDAFVKNKRFLPGYRGARVIKQAGRVCKASVLIVSNDNKGGHVDRAILIEPWSFHSSPGLDDAGTALSIWLQTTP